MLERLLEFEDFCKENSKSIISLTILNRTWKSIGEIKKVLEHVAKITTELQAENLLATDFIIKWKNTVANLRKIDSVHSKTLFKYIEIHEKQIFENSVIKPTEFLDKRANILLTLETKKLGKGVLGMLSEKKKRLDMQENAATIKEDKVYH